MKSPPNKTKCRVRQQIAIGKLIQLEKCRPLIDPNVQTHDFIIEICRNQRLEFGPSSANLCSGAMFIDTVDERRCPSEHALLLILIFGCIYLEPYRFAAFTGWIDLE